MTWTKALTDEQERKLVVDFEDGFKVIELVDRYGVSKSTVGRILADYGARKSKNQPKGKGMQTRKTKRAKAKGRVLKPCGTNAAYQRHKKNGEYPCIPCVEAHAAEQKRWSDAKKEKK